jgi:hypothetical protein
MSAGLVCAFSGLPVLCVAARLQEEGTSVETTQNLGSIRLEPVNQELAGIEQQLLQIRAAITQVTNKIVDCKQRIAAVLGQFRELANIHNFENRYLPGHESFTWVHEEQTAKARNYLFFSVCASIGAVVFGVYFTSKGLTAESWIALYIGAALVAVVLGILGGGVLWTTIGAHPERPQANRHVNLSVTITGGLLFALLAIFAWTRFVAHALSDVSTATLIAGIELTAILLAGAFLCGYGIFIWSKKLDGLYHQLMSELTEYQIELAEKEELLAEKVVTLQELKYNRLHKQPTHQTHGEEGEEVTK